MSKERWSVRIRATVIKTVYCEACTREQALDDPYSFAYSEVEDFTEDFDVMSCVAIPAPQTVEAKVEGGQCS